MLLSVVIVNWNRKDDVLRAIQSLKDQSHRELEIIVVDNHSDDGSQQAIRDKFPDVILMEMPHSKFSACYTFNIGMEAAKGEVVAIMDNDATFEKDWAELAIRHLNENKDVGAVTSKIVNVYKEHFFFQYETWPDYSDEKEYDIYTFRGCAFAMRGDLLRKIGAYPEEYEIYANEDDLAARIWAAGYKIRYYADLSANHYTSKVQRPGWRMVYFTTRNRIWTYLRYLSPAMAMVHIFWALYVEGPMVIKAGQTKHLLKGFWDGFKELPRLGKKRKFVPEFQHVMWKNERDGQRRRKTAPPPKQEPRKDVQANGQAEKKS
jgi:GT2 family glycosyltransferase